MDELDLKKMYESSLLNKVISIKVSEKMRDALIKKAERERVPFSFFVRQIFTNYLINDEKKTT